MERKIDEIFTCNGKLYQVVKGFSCNGCAFIENGNCYTADKLLGPCTYMERSDKTSVIFKEIKGMEIKNNQLTIDIPEGHIIDVEHSDLSKGIIKFKKSNITYKDIEDALNLEENLTGVACNINNVAKLSAIDKLINIANYYNKGWKPDWSNNKEGKFYISYNFIHNVYFVIEDNSNNVGTIVFKRQEDAQAVIGNPNFREILDVIYKN